MLGRVHVDEARDRLQTKTKHFNMILTYKGRVHDDTHCCNLGKKCVPTSNYVPCSIYNEVDSRFLKELFFYLSRGNEKLLKSQQFTRR